MRVSVEQTGIEIIVHPFENLLIDCASDVGAELIIRPRPARGVGFRI